MPYDFKKLEDIVHNSLKPSAVIKVESIGEYLSDQQILLSAAIRQSKVKISGDYYTASTVGNGAPGIRHAMAQTLALTNRLFAYQLSQYNKSLLKYPELAAYKGCYRQMENQLIGLYVFLARGFKRSIDWDCEVPYRFMYSNLAVLKKLLERLKLHGINNNIDPQLVEIAAIPIATALTGKLRVSYRQFCYLFEYQYFLAKYIEREHFTAKGLCNLLVQLRFNRADFMQYYSARLKTSFIKATKGNQKTLYFLTEISLLNRKPALTHFAYLQRPEILDMLSEWMHSEIATEGQCCPLPAPVPVATRKEKVKFNLSVEEISIAGRLLMEAGIIQSRNISELVRFIADNASTVQQQDLSIISLRSKIYSDEPVILKRLEARIFELLKTLKLRK